MKRLFRDIYIMMLAAVAVVMAACSSDDAIDNGNGQLSDNNLAEVRLHIAPATTSGVTRAWQDPNATDDEMMNIWVVVITTDANVVEKVIACKPTGTSREVDAIENLPLGTHKFYSFANMSVDYLATLLGITINMPTMSADDTVYEATTASGTVNADKNVTVIGNGFDRLDSEGDGIVEEIASSTDPSLAVALTDSLSAATFCAVDFRFDEFVVDAPCFLRTGDVFLVFP